MRKGRERRTPGGRVLLARASIVALGLLVSAFTLLAQPATSSNRFLFIVDVSSGMKPFDKSVRDSVFDLIFSGVRGYMTNGDTYGVWLVHERNDTSFPMESWKSKFAVEIATKATLHVREHGFKGKPRLDVAFGDLQQVIENVRDLTIILVSNGETPVRGTPFDDRINEAFADLAPKMRRAKAALNTTFVAQDGQIAGWAVNSPEFLVRIPDVPARPKPQKPEIAQSPTNTPTSFPANSAAVSKTEGSRFLGVPPPAPMEVPAPVAPLPRITASPIIITRETVADEKAAIRALAMTSTNSTVEVILTNPPLAKTTNAEAAITNLVAAQPVTNLSGSAASSNMPAVSAPNLSPKATNSVAFSQTNAAPLAFANAESNTADALAEAASTNGVSAVGFSPRSRALQKPAPPRNTLATHWIVVIASLCGGLVAVLVLVFARTRKREPSLISQAAARQRMSNCHSPS